VKLSYAHGITILYRMRYSIFRKIIIDFPFWITILSYCMMRWYMVTPPSQPVLPLTAVTAMCSISAFLLVFYISKIYDRYMNIFWLSISLEGRIFDMTLMGNNLLPPTYTLRLFRYLNAAHILAYVGCTDLYTEDNLFGPLNEEYQLLSPTEYERIRAIGFNGGNAYREVIAWIRRDINELYKNKVISDMHENIFLDHLFRFRGGIGGIYETLGAPVPFIYVNFVYVVSCAYPFIYATAAALSFNANLFLPAYEMIMLCTVVINSSFAIGVRAISYKLHDPFGLHLEDFDVLHFLTFTLQSSGKLIHHVHVPPPDSETEFNMNKKRNFGGAFRTFNGTK